MKATGERQVAATLEDIRFDHRARYEWVAAQTAATDRVFDAGCGVGYGSSILAEHVTTVLAYDSDTDAITFAHSNWQRDNVRFEVGNLHTLSLPDDAVFDCVVAFEIIEHLVCPVLFLRQIWRHMPIGGRLYISFPNEAVIAHTVELNPFHIRHYTPDNLSELARAAGFEVIDICHQGLGQIESGTTGQTLIATCKKRAEISDPNEASGYMHTIFEAFQAAEKEIVLRANTIRNLQKEIRRKGDLKDMIGSAISEDAKLRQEIDRRRAGEEAAVAEVIRLEQYLLRLEARSEEAETQLAEICSVRDTLRERLNETSIRLAAQGMEISRLREHLVNRTKRNKELESKLVRERKERLARFDPNKPTVMSLTRLLVRNRFFLGILLKAPINSALNIRRLLSRKSRSK